MEEAPTPSPPESPPLELPVETPPAPDPYPFWNYADIVVFFGLAFPCVLLGYGVVQALLWAFRVHVRSPALALVPAQFLGYGFAFFALYVLLRYHYDRPFWTSLRWVRTRPGAARSILYGFVLAYGVALVGRLLETPDVNTPMKQLLADPSSALLIAIFAVTLGPLCEELAFRGFLQPLLVRSFGPAAGIVLAAVPFGILHLGQYGNSWRHVMLVTLAGIGFGWMRQASGSTRASAFMHGAYNFIFVVALFTQWMHMPTPW